MKSNKIKSFYEKTIKKLKGQKASISPTSKSDEERARSTK